MNAAMYTLANNVAQIVKTNQTAEAIAAAQDAWENELDMMGTEASLAEYEAHLAKAPNPNSEMAKFLEGVIIGRSQPFALR